MCRQIFFSMFWTSSLTIRGIRGYGIEALSNLVPDLEQLHTLALWGRLWSRLDFRFWNGVRLPIPWDKTVTNNIFGEVKLALKEAPSRKAKGHPGLGQHVPGAIRCALLPALVLERPLKVRQKGCRLQIGHAA